MAFRARKNTRESQMCSLSKNVSARGYGGPRALENSSAAWGLCHRRRGGLLFVRVEEHSTRCVAGPGPMAPGVGGPARGVPCVLVH